MCALYLPPNAAVIQVHHQEQKIKGKLLPGSISLLRLNGIIIPTATIPVPTLTGKIIHTQMEQVVRLTLIQAPTIPAAIHVLPTAAPITAAEDPYPLPATQVALLRVARELIVREVDLRQEALPPEEAPALLQEEPAVRDVNRNLTPCSVFFSHRYYSYPFMPGDKTK